MAAGSTILSPSGSRQTVGAAVLAVGCAATVGTALVFEHVGGYIPCALCLQERHPYYAAIGLASAAFIAAAGRAPGLVSRGLIALVALAMLYGLALGVHHAGVEWQLWTGPTDCAGSAADLGGSVLDSIDRIQPPACDRAAGRFLGLSFAGWNVVASALFAVVALRTAFVTSERAI